MYNTEEKYLYIFHCMMCVLCSLFFSANLIVYFLTMQSCSAPLFSLISCLTEKESCVLEIPCTIIK